MGCQTGFYLLVRNQKPADVFAVTKEVLEQILAYEGPVFGASAIECGNYKNLDLAAAKDECRAYLDVLKQQTNMEFSYPAGE
jgi:S-ribosylhomocysteine lyase